jgi:hypothetical protein
MSVMLDCPTLRQPGSRAFFFFFLDTPKNGYVPTEQHSRMQWRPAFVNFNIILTSIFYINLWLQFEILVFVCRGVWVTYKRVLDSMIGFIDTLYIPLGTTSNYSAIAIFTLYSSLLHTLVSSVFTSRILATDSSHCNCNILWSFLCTA